MPVRVRSSNIPFSRTSSLLSSAPSTPDAYRASEEEPARLQRADRWSREDGLRSPQFYRAKIIDILPPRKRVNKDQLDSSPPSTSTHTVPLTTIHSQAALPTFDFDDLQPHSPLPTMNSTEVTTPPSTKQPLLPPRSDSRVPWVESTPDGAAFHHDNSSEVGGGHEFDHFSGVVEQRDFNDAITDFDDSFEENDDTSMHRGLRRFDSPMQFSPGSDSDHAIQGPINSGEEAREVFSKQKQVADVQKSSVSVPQTQEHTDCAETMPYAARYLPRLASQAPKPQPTAGFPHTGGLAGVSTPGKMRAARAALQHREPPSFARTTASVTAKISTSVPPDIPRVVRTGSFDVLKLNANCTAQSQREIPSKLELPSKNRSMLGRLGGLFHKGAKKEKQLKFPSPVRLRIGRDPTNSRLKTKRLSTRTALEFHRSPTPPSPSPRKAPEWTPAPLKRSSSQATLTLKSKCKPPVFRSRSVSPISNVTAAQTLADGALPERTSGHFAIPNAAAPFDGSVDTTMALCRKLIDQVGKELDSGRQNKLLVLVEASDLSNGGD